MSNNMNQELYAFWEYDLYPYLLGGTVTQITSTGAVKTKEFGNSLFRPIIILPLESGIQLANKLKELDSEYRKARCDIELDFTQKLFSALPFKHPRKSQ